MLFLIKKFNMHKEIKLELYTRCMMHLKEKAAKVSLSMKEMQEAVNMETKSSAGDKHETARSMMQLEIEKLSAQLKEWLTAIQEMEKIKPEKICSKGEAGALVICENANYYIAVAAGKLNCDDKNYFAISPLSPIGAELMGKTAGDDIDFRGQKIIIKNIL